MIFTSTPAKTVLAICLALATSSSVFSQGGKPVTGIIQTSFGEVGLDKGLPATAADSKKLFDELDFPRACQT